MKIMAFSFSKAGAEIGKRLEDFDDYSIKHYNHKELKSGVKKKLEEKWDKLDGIIFISASGIAIRLIHPFIEHKTKDPAIIVIDDMAKFTISLLSGHLGGANSLTRDISKYLKNTPVITTASDGRGIESLDMFAKRNNYYMEDMDSITVLTRKMVDNEKIGIYTEDGILPKYYRIERIYSLDKLENLDGLIIVSSELIDEEIDIPYTILRPRNINIGIGCRKNKEKDKIIEAIEDLFLKLGISSKSIGKIGTVEIKKDEKGIIEAAKNYGVPMKIFSLEEIAKVDHMFNKSEFVKKTIGVYSVAEPSAYLLGGKFISMRTRHEGITLSVTKEDENG